MKKTIITLALVVFTGVLVFADSNEPDSMYIHFTTTDGADSVVAHTLANIDSIVYYAPVVTEPDYAQPSGTFIDSRDSKTYKWVTIGTQTWMAANLQATVAIVDTTGGTADGVCQTNDVFVWNNTDDTYGKLYSWEAAKIACPAGWHLPSDEEWKALEMYLGMSQSGADDTEYRGTDEGDKLKSTSGWTSSSNGTNYSGFTALPGGYCHGNGTHSNQGNLGRWWSSTPDGSYGACYRGLYFNSIGVDRDDDDRSNGLSVRCVRD